MNDSIPFPRARWLVLLAAVLCCISSQVAYHAVAPVLPQIAVSLHINLGAASNLVMTTFLLAGCVSLVLGGVVCDRYGVLATLILGFLCAAAPAASMPWIGHSTTGVFWARIVEGCSHGFALPAVSPIVAVWFPRHQKGLALGFMSASVAGGSAIALVAGPAVLAVTKDWQTMSAWLSLFGWTGLVFAAVLAMMPRPQLPAPPRGTSEASDGALFRQALLSTLTMSGILLTFVATWGMHCLYGLTPAFLAADKPVGAGYGSMTAGQLMLGVTLLGGIVGPIVCGQLLDRVFKGNAQTVFLMGFAMMCVFVYLLRLPEVTGRPSVLEATLILAGFGIQFVMPTIYYFVAKAYPPQLAGKMSGLWMGIGTFGGVLGLYIGGVTVKSQSSYHTTLGLQALAALAGFILVFALAAAQKSTARKAAASAQPVTAGR
jgi:MFS family permease